MPFSNSLNYELSGDSKLPPIVFLHGFMGNSASWSEVIEALQNEFYCIAIDLPGHGKSVDAGAEIYTMPNCAKSIIAILGELNLEKTNLVGYSMGGRLALYTAINYSNKINRLIVESASPGLRTEEERETRKVQDNNLADKVRNISIEKFVDQWYEQPLFAALGNFPKKLKQLKKERYKNNPDCLAKSLIYMGTGVQPSLWENLVNLPPETLLIVGELDSKFQMIAKEMCAINENIKLQIFNDTGHNVHFEKPKMYAETVKNFLI